MGSMIHFMCAVFFVGAAAAATEKIVPKCIRPNEMLTCVKDCPPERSCRNRGIKFRCADDNKNCRLQCRCKPNHYRTYLGDCALEEVCDKCPGDHEFFDCGGECDNECSTIDTQNRTNCPYVNIQCNKKCYCEDGYARDGNEKCVPVAQCTKETKNVCTRPNEVHVRCKPVCPPEYFISLEVKFKCAANPPCVPGCACKPGYLRPKEGDNCVPINQ